MLPFHFRIRTKFKLQEQCAVTGQYVHVFKSYIYYEMYKYINEVGVYVVVIFNQDLQKVRWIRAFVHSDDFDNDKKNSDNMRKEALYVVNKFWLNPTQWNLSSGRWRSDSAQPIWRWTYSTCRTLMIFQYLEQACFATSCIFYVWNFFID